MTGHDDIPDIPLRNWSTPEEEYLAEEDERQQKRCAQEIVVCFNKVRSVVGRDVAWELFAVFLQRFRPKRQKKKGPHDHELDTQLKATGALRGDARKKAIQVLSKETNTEVESLERRIRRLRRAEREEQQSLAEWHAWLKTIDAAQNE